VHRAVKLIPIGSSTHSLNNERLRDKTVMIMIDDCLWYRSLGDELRWHQWACEPATTSLSDTSQILLSDAVTSLAVMTSHLCPGDSDDDTAPRSLDVHRRRRFGLNYGRTERCNRSPSADGRRRTLYSIHNVHISSLFIFLYELLFIRIGLYEREAPTKKCII